CGILTREKALREIQNTNYPYKEEIIDYVIEKLGLTKKEFDRIYSRKPKNFLNFSTYYPLIQFLKFPIMIGRKMQLIPEIIYLKYFVEIRF
ncbi:MAG: N-acetyl sugar amidotransferase, partial [Patescibacteria group bacterium]|nr:N-acetyl sugar amidotransferase [Patescibacteria group bacterium]